MVTVGWVNFKGAHEQRMIIALALSHPFSDLTFEWVRQSFRFSWKLSMLSLSTLEALALEHIERARYVQGMEDGLSSFKF